MGSINILQWLVPLLLLVLLLLPWILYIRSIQLTVEAIDPQRREMSPGTAWLLLIPIFNLIWLFIVVARIRHSFRNMDEAGRLRRPTTASSDAGLALAICLVLSIIPYVNILTG